MKLHEFIDSFFFPLPPKRQPHIVLQELIQGVYRYADYPAMARMYAEKAQEYAQKQDLKMNKQDIKGIEMYFENTNVFKE